MSPIGRIFIVLNLVLAALFLGWASNTLATSQAFKEKFLAEQTAHETTKQSSTRELTQVRAELAEARGEASRFASERDERDTRIARLNADLAAARAENDEMRGNVAKLANSYEQTLAQNKELVSQKDQAVAARHEAEQRAGASERSEQQAKTALQEAQRNIASLNNTISDLEVAVAQGKSGISSLETQIAMLVDKTGVSLSELVAQKAIDGAVMQVLYDIPPGLLAINKGSNDGVQRGYTFEIYDGKQYKGRARVENVRPDMSTCILQDVVPGQTVRQGDRASTVL